MKNILDSCTEYNINLSKINKKSLEKWVFF